MSTFTMDATVDEIVASLAERRARERAYLALARAIVLDEALSLEEREPAAA